jgi:hypothetical protein
MNLGHGRFAPAQSYAVGQMPTAVATGDVTGDGKPDIVVTEGAVSEVSILAGNGDGTFRAPQSFPTGPDPMAFALADLNGNGRLDIVTATQSNYAVNAAPAGVSVLMNLGGGEFATPVNFGTISPTGLVLGDFNGDGKVDIAVSGPGTIGAFWGNGDGTFRFDAYYVASPGALGLPAGPFPLVAGPFFGRGRTDMAVGISSGNSIDLFKANRLPSGIT